MLELDTPGWRGAGHTTTVPIMVAGCLGAALVAGTNGPARSPETGSRLAGLAEAANAQLIASRARTVAAAENYRWRLHLDVHDGAQQRLVDAVIAIKMALSTVTVGSVAAVMVQEALTNVHRASSELRSVVHGILPQTLIYGGLSVAL